MLRLIAFMIMILAVFSCTDQKLEFKLVEVQAKNALHIKWHYPKNILREGVRSKGIPFINREKVYYIDYVEPKKKYLRRVIINNEQAQQLMKVSKSKACRDFGKAIDLWTRKKI